jgi:hypothetical protein
MSILPLSGTAADIHHGGMTPSGLDRIMVGSGTSERRIDRRQRLQTFRSTRLQQEETTTRPSTLLVIDPGNRQQLTARRNRWWTRLGARLLASYLDRQLAQGRPPEETRLLGARAQVLVSPVMRFTLAEMWSDTLEQVRRPPVMRNPRVPMNRDSIIASGQEIQTMIEALLAPAPVSVRGPAMVSWLLSDGAGPLYDRRRSADVADALREAIAQLDPRSLL